MSALRDIGSSALGTFLFVTALGVVLAVPLGLLVSDVSYSFAWTIFPIACPSSIGYHGCPGSSQTSGYWSFWVWGVAAIAWGVITRKRPAVYRFWLAIPAVLFIIVLMQRAMPVFGYQFFVDTL